MKKPLQKTTNIRSVFYESINMKMKNPLQKEHQNIYRIDVPVVSEINAKIGKRKNSLYPFHITNIQKIFEKKKF